MKGPGIEISKTRRAKPAEPRTTPSTATEGVEITLVIRGVSFATLDSLTKRLVFESEYEAAAWRKGALAVRRAYRDAWLVAEGGWDREDVETDDAAPQS